MGGRLEERKRKRERKKERRANQKGQVGPVKLVKAPPRLDPTLIMQLAAGHYLTQDFATKRMRAAAASVFTPVSTIGTLGEEELLGDVIKHRHGPADQCHSLGSWLHILKRTPSLIWVAREEALLACCKL